MGWDCLTCAEMAGEIVNAGVASSALLDRRMAVAESLLHLAKAQAPLGHHCDSSSSENHMILVLISV